MSNFSQVQQSRLKQAEMELAAQKQRLLEANKQAAQRHLLSIKLLLAQKPLK